MVDLLPLKVELFLNESSYFKWKNFLLREQMLSFKCHLILDKCRLILKRVVGCCDGAG